MPRLSAKRQITLPAAQCDELGILPGDDLDIYIHNGRITIIKLTPGQAAGLLKHVQARTDVTEDESRDQAIEAQRVLETEPLRSRSKR